MKKNIIVREFLRFKTQLRGLIYFPIIYYLRTLKRNINFKINNKSIKINKISILCPSRGRPENINRLIRF